ncbi:PD-(D/E)XK nuclease family protein [Lederbergia citri]|uniref:PD-(D/E)XK nuclease family protein n=1 Tax=Lederbergia citri TaxID=2833580 RepID=A0A942TEV1_9BACI|nr:PD-(D/E)XK nuclease family protein [Lederbergia citri]MBS4195481.1 PD-(D/E)XK nuclease family protein [Lederbergia citri]
MTLMKCPKCGAGLIEDASEIIKEREDGGVEVDAYSAYVCEKNCGYTKLIDPVPEIIAQQGEDRLLLLYPNEQGRILELHDSVIWPPMHFQSILARGYWEYYTGNHDVMLLLENARDSESAYLTPPNLFQFATSELSQDAFLCWLLSWGQKGYRYHDEPLHNVALDFVSSIFTAHHLSAPPIRSIEIIRQFKSLDVLAIINNEYAILIEDKTYTKNHSNQLVRYRETVRKEYPNLIQLPIYFKIADQSHYRSVESAGYFPFTRKMMLNIMEKGKDVQNSIFVDYLRHLQSIEQQVSAFWSIPISEWDAFAWQGFYQELQKEIAGDWGYVSNPKGGFWGFWWQQQKKQRYYFQLEKQKLCVKVVAEEGENKRELRERTMKEVLCRSEKENLSLQKPARTRSGKTMTVAEKLDYIIVNDAGLVDIKATIEGLKRF